MFIVRFLQNQLGYYITHHPGNTLTNSYIEKKCMLLTQWGGRYDSCHQYSCHSTSLRTHSNIIPQSTLAPFVVVSFVDYYKWNMSLIPWAIIFISPNSCITYYYQFHSLAGFCASLLKSPTIPNYIPCTYETHDGKTSITLLPAVFCWGISNYSSAKIYTL